MNERVGTSGAPGAALLFVVSAASMVAGAGIAYAVGLARASTEASVARGLAATAAAGAGTIVSEPTPAPPPLDDRAKLGRALFFDPTLSDPAGTSCASCHDPAHGYAGNHGSSAGVAKGSRPGRFAARSTPSVLYLSFVRRFHMEWEEEADAPEPRGGFFWDGRADSLAALVRQPLLNPDEMGNADLAGIAARLEAGAHAADIRAQFQGAFDSPERAVSVLGECIDAFLTSAAMAPFTSKYDAFVRGRAELTPLEARGLALFKDHAKGACSSCHTMDDRSPRPERSPFTDYGYDAVAPPRNRALAANGDPSHFDRGLCDRREGRGKWHTDDPWFCGRFRTPSLRNVAVRESYMHNGAFTRLRDVVAFYSTRETDPVRWYPGGEPYDDMPPEDRRNVNTNPAPYHRRKGDTPTLDDGEIDAIVAFLGTLTDEIVP